MFKDDENLMKGMQLLYTWWMPVDVVHGQQTCETSFMD